MSARGPGDRVPARATRARRRAALAALALAGAAAALLAWTAETEPHPGRLLFGLWRVRHVLGAVALLGAAGSLACAAASRGALFAWLAAGLVVLATGAILELAGQLGLVDYAERLGNRSELATNALGGEARPHLDVRGETGQDTATAWGVPHEPVPFHYRTDARGFRNAVDRDAADVYLLGDSILVAGLVPFEETLTARLEAGLGRPVVAVALIGLGPERQHALFRDAGLPVRGRLVLQLLFEGNDLVDPAPGEAPPPPGRLERLRRRSFVAQAVLALQRWTQPEDGLARIRTCEIDGREHLFHWAFQSFAGHEPRQAPLLDAIERFAREVEADGGRFALVFVPSKLRALGPACDRWPEASDLRDAVDANPLRATTRAWSEATGIPLVDLTGPLRAAARAGDVPWFWGDTHWNATGHAVATEALLASPVLRTLRASARAGASPAGPEAAP